MSRVISSSEVKKHKGPKSTWIIIHNNVYDVTRYLEEHPGGVDPIMEVAGQDGTQAFEDVAHSEDAREVLAQFKIGTLPKNEKTSTPVVRSERVCGSCSAISRKKSVENTNTALRHSDSIVIPKESNLKWAVLALAGALVIGFVLKKYLAA